MEKGNIVNVVFSVGVKHPLYKKSVKAELTAVGTGYNGFEIEAATIDPVHYPEDPKGILEFHGKSVVFKPRPAYDSIHSGFIEKIIFEDGTEVSSKKFRKLLIK